MAFQNIYIFSFLNACNAPSYIVYKFKEDDKQYGINFWVGETLSLHN
jgi:hypothetical protein